MAASDYLEHSLLFKNVQACLEQQGKPLRILDLGCGDAANFARTVAQIPGSVASYTGVDMSDSALQSAHANLRQALGPAFPLFLHVNDILSYLKTLYGAYDVVLTAFALHHLTSEDKLEAMKEIKRVLAQDGVFIMVDPFRKEGESLAAYRQRATEVGGTWVDMGSEQQANFIKHMQDYDIVEEEAFFDIAVEQAGFSKKEIVCAGKKGLQSNVVVFRQ